MSSQELDDHQGTQVAGFIAKTFQILNNQQFAKIVFWSTNGAEFIIKDTNKFQQIVLPRYFRHNKMNSFIRQLNMYGFHKSRTEHFKSVFSHPSFLKDRQDLLITIKRKIKAKDRPVERPIQVKILQTPKKQRKVQDLEQKVTTLKGIPQTGNELTTVRRLSFGEIQPNTTFNLMLGSKDRLVSNLNVSMGRVSQNDLLPIEDSCSDQCVSIEEKMGVKQQQFKELKLKFDNPSCFLTSMKK